jgi:LuxR family maltose regulon positive regulatory protein
VQSDQHASGVVIMRTKLGCPRRGRVGVERPGHAPPPAGEPSSESEVRVLRLLSGDLTYREIGRRLHLSVNTVPTHAQRIRRKLGVSTRAGAVARARQLGLI